MQSSKVRLFVQSLSGLAEYCIYIAVWPAPVDLNPLNRQHLCSELPHELHTICLFMLYLYTHTHNSIKHMHTLHMCCFISIHGCNSCNSCVLVCTWINIKAWTVSQLKTTYVCLLITTMVETPRGQRSETPRGPDVSQHFSWSRSGVIRSCWVPVMLPPHLTAIRQLGDYTGGLQFPCSVGCVSSGSQNHQLAFCVFCLRPFLLASFHTFCFPSFLFVTTSVSNAFGCEEESLHCGDPASEASYLLCSLWREWIILQEH